MTLVVRRMKRTARTACDDLYARLDNKEGDTDSYRFDKAER